MVTVMKTLVKVRSMKQEGGPATLGLLVVVPIIPALLAGEVQNPRKLGEDRQESIPRQRLLGMPHTRNQMKMRNTLSWDTTRFPPPV
jgi:hypothetical protein